MKGTVGENLRNALDWLPKGRALLTIKKDCELTDYIPGLPSLQDIAVADGQDTEGLKAFYEKYGFKGLVKQLEIHDVPPELLEEHKSRKKVGPGPAPGRELTFLEQVLGNIGRNPRPADQRAVFRRTSRANGP